ncbi:MAG: hypothetical protein WAN60_01510 [Candidatus Sulfotelmatobacter sp.]
MGVLLQPQLVQTQRGQTPLAQDQLVEGQAVENRLAQDQLAQNLQGTNRRLRFWLESLFPGRESPSAATPQQMAGLLSELLRAGEWLRRGLPQEQERDAELQSELGHYRRNVLRLRELLPSIQKVLLHEKARLEAERARVECAAEWARGSRRTL